MFASVVVLTVSLYVILKTINKNLALLALSLRLIEAALGGVAVLLSFIILQLINGQSYMTAFETEQMQALIGLFLNVRTAGYTIIIVFCCLGSIPFFYLFFKSKYVPKILSGYGIISFSLMLIYAFINILLPKSATMLVMDNILAIICYVPGALFEIIIGFWLLIKGVNVQQRDNRAPASL